MTGIHVRAFEHFFLTQLGPMFLREYYRAVYKYDAGITLVACSPDLGSVEGFAAGFVDPPAFYAHLRSRRLRLAFAALPQLLRNPALLPRLLGNARRVTRNGLQAPSSRESELASIAVSPLAQGKGLGKLLVKAFLAQSRRFGADCVSLTTDAYGNDRVHGFYQTLGFRVRETFIAQGNRHMDRYEVALTSGQAACPILGGAP